MELEFSEQIFYKYSNIKFHTNLFSGSQVVPSGWMDRWRDMTELIVTFCNTENTPNEEWKNLVLIFQV